MIKDVESNQYSYLERVPEKLKKERGQFFTDASIASYMSSLFDFSSNKEESIKVLDAGAGAGVLTVALCLRALEDPTIKTVEAVLYEIDKEVLPLLEANLIEVENRYLEEGKRFSFSIRNTDFVLDRPDKRGERYDYSIINPPYFKYSSKDSKYSDATIDLFKGNPNIYASFMAIVAACLSEGGEQVAIVPRSFANGLYFRGFRKYLVENLSIEMVHLYSSRASVFKKLDVLQENVIIKLSNCTQQPFVSIRTSFCSGSSYDYKEIACESDVVIDPYGGHNFIRLPEDRLSYDTLLAAEEWDQNFEQSGYFISTGPVVEHRNKAYITSANDADAVSSPLLKMHNVKFMTVNWDGASRKDLTYLKTKDTERFWIENLNYVLVKRFSSKEEKKRLTAGVWYSKQGKEEFIAVENHLNYIGLKGEAMSEEEATGLCAILNSSFMDNYFRSVSGNTQINATEIRCMKFPNRTAVKGIGTRLFRNHCASQKEIDYVVESVLIGDDIVTGRKTKEKVNSSQSSAKRVRTA